MAQQPTTTLKCAHCGQLFEGNPRSQPLGRLDYCSIACEEGRAPRAMSDPQSADYHLHLKAEPQSLVGKTLLASGLKYVDYSPEGINGPHFTTPTNTISCDQQEEWYIRRDDVVIGEVVDYGADGYTVEHENIETGQLTTRTFGDFLTVAQIRRDRWWVDG